jgi:hypothetical protein
MAETGGFLARWSRLKRAEDAPVPPPPAGDEPVLVAAAPVEATAPAEVVEPGCEPVDLGSLPPLDSLCAESDYTGFLRQGVPEPLQALALRKAWATDPAIAGFRGFAEYDWDCNAQGYGALLPTDDVVRLCEAVLGPPPAAEPEAPAEELPAEAPVQLAAAGTDDAAGEAVAEPAAGAEAGLPGSGRAA